jgi:hypothetical protein
MAFPATNGERTWLIPKILFRFWYTQRGFLLHYGTLECCFLKLCFACCIDLLFRFFTGKLVICIQPWALCTTYCTMDKIWSAGTFDFFIIILLGKNFTILSICPVVFLFHVFTLQKVISHKISQLGRLSRITWSVRSSRDAWLHGSSERSCNLIWPPRRRFPQTD